MAAGDERAPGEPYDRWSPLPGSVPGKLLGDADDVEEALEDTFQRAWRPAARYEEPRGSIGTWLTLMARSRVTEAEELRAIV